MIDHPFDRYNPHDGEDGKKAEPAVLEFCQQRMKDKARVKVVHLCRGNEYGAEYDHDIGIYQDEILSVVVDSHLRRRSKWTVDKNGWMFFKYPTVSILCRKIAHAQDAWSKGLKIQHHIISPDHRTIMVLTDKLLREEVVNIDTGETKVEQCENRREDGTLEKTWRAMVPLSQFQRHIRTESGLWVQV